MIQILKVRTQVESLLYYFCQSTINTTIQQYNNTTIQQYLNVTESVTICNFHVLLQLIY